MSDNTAIEWADATWNPITGCSIVSPGCANCYAMRLAGGRLRHHPTRAGLTKMSNAGPVWTGEVRFNDGVLDQPLRWRRPRRIFVCAHGDLFHEHVPWTWIDRVFSVMLAAPQHQFLVLTKRAERMRMFCSGRITLLNVWLGVSVEDQRTADVRIPVLLATPAARRWISAEPLLEAIDLNRRTFVRCPKHDTAYGFCMQDCGDWITLDWVVVGGESGQNSRRCDVQWIRDIVRTCSAARVPVFVKQLGRHAVTGDVRYPSIGVGRDPRYWPDDLRVRQWPMEGTGSQASTLNARRSGDAQNTRSP